MVWSNAKLYKVIYLDKQVHQEKMRVMFAATVPHSVQLSVRALLVLPASQRGSRELCWELHGAQFFKMSSLEQRLSRIEEKLKQENEEARRRIDLNIDMSPQRPRPRPSECSPGRTGESVTVRIAGGKIGEAEGGREGVGVLSFSYTLTG